MGEPLLDRRDLLLQRRNAPIGDLGGLLEIAAPRRLVGLHAQLLQLRLLGVEPRDRLLLGLPLRLHRRRLLSQLGELLLDTGAALFRRLVLLLREGGQLDLVLNNLALDLVNLLRQRVDLDAQPARRFVHQVDGLVRQEPVADVAV